MSSDRILSIELERVCDGHVDCSDQSDELNCSDHFYCLYSKHPLFVSRYLFTCGDIYSILDIWLHKNIFLLMLN